MSDLYIIIAVLVSILLVILATSKWKINAFYSLISVSLLLSLFVIGSEQTVSVLKSGFGSTLGSIGLIIVFGTCLGVMLDKSESTIGMANFILNFTSKDKSSRAITLTGTIAGLPIFCDSGFIVLSGLNKSLSRKSGIPVGRMAASLAISLFTLHCFVPPHPGITAAVGIMDANLGKMVMLGVLTAIPGIIVGYLWIKLVSSKKILSDADLSDEPIEEEKDIPNAFMSFLPVFLPLILITLNSFQELLGGGANSIFIWIIKFTGNPVIALFIGLCVAILILPKKKFRKTDTFLLEGIEKSGPILLITAAGGTFGAVIKATGLGDIISQGLSISHLGLLVPYLIAMFLKTAQGSSTVAAITSASIVAPLLPALGMDTESAKIYALLALGAGTLTISHTNDSFFWVVTKFSGISPKTTLKLFSSATLVVSLFCLGMVYLISFLGI